MHTHDLSRWSHQHDFSEETSAAERGTRWVVAITASISLAVIVFLRFEGGTSICIAPTSSITSIALSGSLRSLM